MLWKIVNLFSPHWWADLLEKDMQGRRPTFRQLLCRAKGHEAAAWWTSAEDGASLFFRCVDCGERLD